MPTAAMNGTGDNAKANDADIYHQGALKRQHQLEVIKTLGEGTHGKVVLATDPASMQQFAVKMITKKSLNSDRDKFHIQREIDIQSKLRHPHIISVYEVYETETTVTLVMEYASGGELFDYINSQSDLVDSDGNHCVNLGGLSDGEARQFFSHLVSAVQYLHSNGVVHRDLKLENILLDACGNAKLADFGLSTTFGHGHLLKTYCGSPLYASPEIVNARPYIGPEVDCWSLGVLLYAMLYGTMPFTGHDFRTLRRQITSGLIHQPPILSGAHDLILHILEPSLEQRATLRDIATHPWLHGRPRQDSNGLYVISPLDLSSDGSTKQAGDGIDENVDKSSPVSDGNRMHFYSDYHGTVARVSVASSFDDSLSLWENDDPSLSVPRSHGQNVVPSDEECSAHWMQVGVKSGDYIPLCDNSAIDDGRHLSPNITSSKDLCKTAGGDTFSDRLISNPRTLSDFDVHHSSGNAYCKHHGAIYKASSDAGQVIAHDVPSLVTSGALSTTTDAATLRTNFSADSLEVFADGCHDEISCDDSNTDEYHDCDDVLADDDDEDDDDGGDSSHCVNYDFADIDAVLDHIASDTLGSSGADADEGSQVSYDSLEDAV